MEEAGCQRICRPGLATSKRWQVWQKTVCQDPGSQAALPEQLQPHRNWKILKERSRTVEYAKPEGDGLLRLTYSRVKSSRNGRELASEWTL